MKPQRAWIYGASVIITGASDGIGKELARILVKKYACSVLGVARSEDKLAATALELGDRFSYVVGDVTDSDLWNRIASEFDEKPYSILINNAGVMLPFSTVLNTSEDELRRTMEVNFFAPVFAARTLLPLMKKACEKPAIINICSSSALCPLAATGAYSASKSALKAFTEALGAEERKTAYVGIVFAGFTKTALFRSTDGFFDSKAVSAISSDPKKTAEKIVKATVKRKRRSVIGLDAKGMNLLYKLAPKKAAPLIDRVMKKAKLEAYTTAFAERDDDKRV